MAKDGDIIDLFLGWIVDFVVWVFTGIWKLIWIIISETFKGIVSLFKK